MTQEQKHTNVKMAALALELQAERDRLREINKELLDCLKNLVEYDLIKDATHGDHWKKIDAVIALADTQ